MKKIFTGFVFSITMLSGAVFGAQTSVQCDTNKIFTDNTCDVCFTDTATSTTATVDIKDIKIPWGNKQTKSEVAYKIESVQPDIISSLTTATTPATATDVWKFTNPWTGNLNEFVLTAGKTTTFVETNTTAKITITDKSSVTDKTVLIKSPLLYHDRTTTAPITETEEPKTRNTCVLYKITFGPGGTQTMSGEVAAPKTSNTSAADAAADAIGAALDAAANDTTDDEDPVVDGPALADDTAPVLDSAPEEDAAVDTTAATDVAEKNPPLNSAGPPKATSIPTGPAVNILFLITIILSTGIMYIRPKFFSK